MKGGIIPVTIFGLESLSLEIKFLKKLELRKEFWSFC